MEDTANVFEQLAGPRVENPIFDAVEDLTRSLVMDQPADNEAEGALVLTDARLLEGNTEVPMPEMYTVSLEKVLETPRCKQLVLKLLRKSGGTLTHDIAYIVYMELVHAYKSCYKLDITTALLFESLCCYLPLFLNVARRILTEDIYSTFARIARDGVGYLALSKDEVLERKRHYYDDIEARERETKVARTDSRDCVSPVPSTSKESEPSDDLLLASLLEEISPFMRLGSLFNGVVPISSAKILKAVASVEGVYDGQNKVLRECLRVDFVRPVLFQLVGRKVVSTKPGANNGKPNYFPSISSAESKALIELLQKQVHPCDRMQFWENVSVCTLKEMGQVNCFTLAKGKQQKELSCMLEVADKVNMVNICDEKSSRPCFIFASNIQIFCKEPDSNRFSVRLFPRPLLHFGPGVYVLSFDESKSSSNFYDWKRLLH